MADAGTGITDKLVVHFALWAKLPWLMSRAPVVIATTPSIVCIFVLWVVSLVMSLHAALIARRNGVWLAVLLFSKSNRFLFGYFDPENNFLDHEIQ